MFFLEPAYTEKDILSCDALHYSLLYIGARKHTHQSIADEGTHQGVDIIPRPFTSA